MSSCLACLLTKVTRYYSLDTAVVEGSRKNSAQSLHNKFWRGSAAAA